MAFATTADLVEYVPDIVENGIENFDDQLTKAQTDIEKMIKVRWFDQEYASNTIYRLHRVGAEWDATKLDETQWTKCCVYRALANYIFPNRPDKVVFGFCIVCSSTENASGSEAVQGKFLSLN